jgi:hypothetical protein
MWLRSESAGCGVTNRRSAHGAVKDGLRRSDLLTFAWAILGGLVLLLAIYFVGAEEGATSLIPGMYVHEFVHDGRHLLGFPCH